MDHRMKKYLGILFSTLLLIQLISPQSNSVSIPDLPLSLPESNIKPLRQLSNKDLQKRLERQLRKNKYWSRLISKKKMAVGLVDFRNPELIKFAQLNGDHMMYAASLPKLAILLAGMQSIEEGELEESPEIMHDMRIMISQSDNAAATRMIDRLRFEKIQDVLTDPQYDLYDRKRGGGLWVGKRYAKRGKRYPDPLMGISHGASVTQVCRFYYLLALGKLVNRQRSEEMLDILVDPEIHHKFVNTLDTIAPNAKIYRKSGTWQNWHSDSALVWGPAWRRYIVTALIEDPNGEKILRELIPAIEEVLKSQALVSSN